MKFFSTTIIAAVALALAMPAASARRVAKAAATHTQNLAAIEEVIKQVKTELAPDSRQTVYEITAHYNDGGRVVVDGMCSDASITNALTLKLNALGIDFDNDVKTYPYNQWALTRLSAASHRTAGRHAAEMATQSVMGTPLRVLERGGEWWRVQTPDGYIAYVPSSSVVAKTPAQMEAWRRADRYIVTAPYQIRVYTTPEATGVRDVVTDLVNGCIVERVSDIYIKGCMMNIMLPDGRKGWVMADDFTPLDKWAAQPFDAERILDTAYSMEGTPYLWGGTSTKALDCSGLAKVSYYSNGRILMRDASQQALTGTRIEAADWPQCQAGDLLFFGNATTGKVTHVAIYDHDGNYVHSSGRVKRNSVDPEAEGYLTTPFLHAVRIAGNEGTPGITLAKNHPWYF